jgi:hypothetical protein
MSAEDRDACDSASIYPVYEPGPRTQFRSTCTAASVKPRRKVTLGYARYQLSFMLTI